MNVLIIDSGISQHVLLKDINIKTTDFEKQESLETVLDSTGHGTAITSLITKDSKNITVYVLKLFNDLYECNIEQLIEALEFVESRNKYDIINMSFGIVTFNEGNQINKLEELCQRLRAQGSILVSAFDNDGAVSYPAYFDCVIGVDTSKRIHKRSEYEYVNNSCVNILGYGLTQKVAWNDPPYTIIEGNSFACANVTNVIARLIDSGCENDNIMEALKENATYERTFDEYTKPIQRPKWMSGMKAILFPYSKEIHSLLAYEDLLDFEIVNVYDIKHNAKIGRDVSQLINYRSVKNRIIHNFQDIVWNSTEFDSVIIGHLDELSSIFKKDLLKEIVNCCLEYGKKIYAFDDLSNYDTDQFSEKMFEEMAYFPRITENNIPKGRFGKLHSINIPVVAIIGTSSSQGKFTVQLSLREKLIKSGYKVSQIGSEPSSLCFGMDFIYPYGYHSTTYTEGYHNIILLNQALHEMEMSQSDICIVGTQTNIAFYGNSNLENIPLQQLEILYGTMPDAFILMINPHDDVEYILRTIRGTEYLIESKCLAIVIYPIMKTPALGSLLKNEDVSKTVFYDDFKRHVSMISNVPVLDMSEAIASNKLVESIVDFFSGQ